MVVALVVLCAVLVGMALLRRRLTARTDERSIHHYESTRTSLEVVARSAREG